jgi:hypothetical protein
MIGIFKEMSSFESRRGNYLSDEEFRTLQNILLKTPGAGDVIKGTGGLRKIRVPSSKRGKGKRGGTRVIYYWYLEGKQFWLFTIYGKDEMSDLTDKQKKALKAALDAEIAAVKKEV